MKRSFAALLALCFLLLAGCAKQNDAEAPVAPVKPAPVVKPAAPVTEPEPASEPVAVYTFDGLEVPVPAEYLELLVIDDGLEPWNAHWTPLVSFFEKASVEAEQLDHPDEDWGDGLLCTVSRLDRIGLEGWLSDGQDAGGYLFAKDGEDAYYLMSYPTDVRIYRAGGTNRPAEEIEGLDSWVELNDWAEALPGEIVALNEITAYTAGELFDADYTYDGAHVELGYRMPESSMDPMDLVVLSLSQPARQGEGGVWCVERVHDVYTDYDFTDTRLVFPAAYGVDETAADYYARLQAECDAGEHPALLTPQGAALDYAGRVSWLFGEDVSATDFELIEALG